MRMQMVVCAIFALVKVCASAGISWSIQNSVIGYGAYMEISLTAMSPPILAPVNVIATSDSPAVGFKNAVTVLPGNRTNLQKLIALGQAVSFTPVAINLFTDSIDPTFAGFNETFYVTVVPTCGVVFFDGVNGTNTGSGLVCPNVGDFVFLSGQYQRPYDIYNGILNITILEGTGFDFFFNDNTQCPSASSNTYSISDKSYNRVDASDFYPGNADSPTNVDYTIGMRKRTDGGCTFTAYVFDSKNASGSPPPNMVCVTPLAVVTSCSTGLLPWQIAVIVICVVVGVALIVTAAVLLFKHFSK